MQEAGWTGSVKKGMSRFSDQGQMRGIRTAFDRADSIGYAEVADIAGSCA